MLTKKKKKVYEVSSSLYIQFTFLRILFKKFRGYSRFIYKKYDTASEMSIISNIIIKERVITLNQRVYL